MGALHDGTPVAGPPGATRRRPRCGVDLCQPHAIRAVAKIISAYPRNLEKDCELLAAEGVDVVFAPTVKTMYPAGKTEVTVQPGPVGRSV